MKRNCLLSLLGCIVLWGSAGFAWSIPTEIGVSGRLLDSNGNPIHYTIHDPMAGTVEQHVTLPSRIDFWDSTTAATPFASLLTVTSAFNGYFNMGFVPPISVITKDVIWYSVAIDVDRNGLTSSDNFPERIQITSMPYALSAKPQNAFVTFQGIANYQYAGFQDPKFLHVTPFETPPGGVEFNQMNIFLTQNKENTSFSFGIYDEKGGKLSPNQASFIARCGLRTHFSRLRFRPSI